MNTRLLLTVAILMLPTASFGAGSSYCGPWSDSGLPSHFDGETISGQDWGCDLKKVTKSTYRGTCDAGSGEYSLILRVAYSGDTVTITFPDKTVATLARCPS